MNNNYMSYKNYVESTDYYKSLCEAIQLANELVDNLTNLIQALGKDNGDIIMSAIEELEYFKSGAEYLVKDYTDEREEILKNASTYDTKFSSLKSTIGNVTSIRKNMTLDSGMVVDNDVKIKVKSISIDDSTGYIRLEKEMYGTLYNNKGKKIANVSPSKFIELYNLSGKVS